MRKSILPNIFLLLGVFGTVSGQNLEIVLDSTFTNLKIGQTFAVTGRVQNSGADIPSGQTIKATVEFVGPDGIAVASHVQTWNGFPEANNPGTLRNDNTNSRVLFQFPWSQAGKAVSGWSIRAFVEGAALETDLSDNSAIHDGFTMDLPDLIVASSSLSTDNTSNTFLPNSVITASGSVRNIGQARTQENILFPLVARLYRGATASPANLVETETLIIPSPDAGGFPYIEEGQELSFTINNIHLPSDAAPEDPFTLTVTVDPSDLAFGDIIHEVSDDGGQQTSTNSFTISDAAVNGARLTVDPDSFEGDVGSFRGLDPIRIAFSVRNEGLLPVQPADNFTVQVALSKNLTFDNSDFILREFDLGGNALGLDLLPNESITLDWIQQLPNNFEGDFYYLVQIESDTNPFFQERTEFLENSPSITIESQNGGNLELVSGVGNNNMERPDSSRDGKSVVYEQTDGNGIQQVYLQQLDANQGPVQISRNSNQNSGNANSLRPKISADGTMVVFHSKADNLVSFPPDDNGVEDIFIYNIDNASLFRIFNPVSLENGNGASLYPDLNQDGSVVVFESLATNLTATSLGTERKILLYEVNATASNRIQAPFPFANGPSYMPSISNDGSKIVFSSEANNLDANDTNGERDIFLHTLDSNETSLANVNSFNKQAVGGSSDQAVISGDGTTIAFRSMATNLVQEKGISLIEVQNGGVGYHGNPTLNVFDLNATGSGAKLEFEPNAIDQYGQILPDSIRIVDHGENYTLPFISIIPDPTQPSPDEVAEIAAFLSHPRGEIFTISTADIMNKSASDQRKYSIRISENYANQVGADEESREPSISEDGKLVIYSTKSSNLLDVNITREDGEVFFNEPIRAAEGRAVISGGIGEIEVENPGSGYQNGFLFINDISGSGTGAVASYQVDSLGRIASITMVNAGSGYDLETTFISVDSPRGGTGFVGSATRYDQGGSIQRIEMIDNGSGYQNIASTNQGKSGLITLDGDGSDSDGDGKPDAKVNSERIIVDYNGTGGIYIEQIIDLELLSANSLLNTTLTFSDYQKTETISFANASTSFTTIGIFGKTLSEITQEVRTKLADLWNNPVSTNRFQGPKISDIPLVSTSTSFRFSALSGRVVSNNPTAAKIAYQSNMLIRGSGFTRATPTIAPAPVIHGFSEVESGTNVSTITNGRNLYLPTIDTDTDDIYLYSSITGKNERISKSSFGLPINYLPSSTTTMPSNRFPALSGNGRIAFFSSDASGSGGLSFNESNQIPSGNNNFRKLFFTELNSQLSIDNTVSVLFGGLTSIEIINAGSGYQDGFLSIFDSSGSGSGATASYQVDNTGRITSITIDSAGSGYNMSTTEISVDNPGNGIGFGGFANIFGTTGIFPLLNKDHLSQQTFVANGFISVTADLNSAGPNLSSVVLLVDGNEDSDASNLTSDIYQGFWQPASSGIYKLQLIALDNSRNPIAKSEVVNVTVEDAYNWSGGLPGISVLHPRTDAFLSTSSSIQLTASATDVDFDLKEVQFYVNGQIWGDPIATPVSGYSDLFPYVKRWQPSKSGLHIIHAVATDHFGHAQMSQAVAVRVTEGTLMPPKPEFSGIVQVAKVEATLESNNTLSFKLTSPGFGYVSPPKVVIDNYGTGGSAAGFEILGSDIDNLTGEILNISNVFNGLSYQSLPEIRLEGGFPQIDAAGEPGTARATSVTLIPVPDTPARYNLYTSVDEEGNIRKPPGLATIGITSRGSGYNEPPGVLISHPTAEGAQAVASMRPAANGRGLEIADIVVTLRGGGRPIRFDDNGTTPIEWLPGYDIATTNISLIGGIPFDEASFEFAEPVFSGYQDSVFSTMRFYAVGNNEHIEFSPLNDTPFRWTFGTPQAGVYALYAELVDSRGNVHASDPIYREVRPGNLPEGDFTTPYRARGEVVLGIGGSVSKIELTSPGAAYNLPPKIIIEGDGSGATASAVIDVAGGTGKILSVNITNPGSGYTYATVTFDEGFVTPQQVDEYTLGETITMGLTAFAQSAEIKEIRLIVNDIEREEVSYPPLTAEPDFGGYEFPSQEYGQDTGQGLFDANIQRLDRWKYDGTMPNYNIYFTPSDLGMYNLSAMLIDHTGFSTITSTYRVRVHNGEPPVIELVTPRTGESFALDYDRNQDIRLVAKAQDPDWQARFGGDQNLDRRDELSRVWFYADDQFVGVGNRVLGTDLYQFVWRPTVAGTFRITAVAVDDQVGDINQDFGDVGRVGGTGTSDPQYVNITERSGSRPPDVFMINPANPDIFAGFTDPNAEAVADPFAANTLNTTGQITDEEGVQTTPIPNDDRNLQPDADPQYLANEPQLAVEYPNLFTSGSKDIVWAWSDDRDGDLSYLQFYINGANAVIQFRSNPISGDTLSVQLSSNSRSFTFGTSLEVTAGTKDIEIGSDTTITAKNTREFLLGFSNEFKFNSYLLPGAATYTEKSTVLINFEDTTNASLTSAFPERSFTWVFKRLPAVPGAYTTQTGHPSAYVLDGLGGTYFGHPFVPGINGIFTIYAVVVDNSDNRVMSIPSHFKASTGTPSGSGSISIPVIEGRINPTINTGSSLVVVASAQSDDPIEYVEFFDNGVLFDTPRSYVDDKGTFHRGRQVEFDEPYYFADWSSTITGEHILYARFTDIKGNSFISNLQKFWVNEIATDFILSPIQLDLKDGQYGVFDGSQKNVFVTADGDPIYLDQLQSVSLYANGEIVATENGVRTRLGSGQTSKIVYNFTWTADYDAYADENGEVRLRVMGGDPMTFSNEEKILIFSPDPFDPSNVLKNAGIGMTDEDTARYNQIAEEIDNPKDVLIEYLAGLESSTVEQHIDLIAARQITLGSVYDNYESLRDDTRYVNNLNDQWLKAYINDQLLSQDYINKFGQVPFLVGAFSQSNTINFSENRFLFFRQCFLNKYNQAPNYQQSFQASRRMLDFFGNFEPGYWELSIGLPDETIDSPPRRDSLPTANVGLNNFENTFNSRGPEAGHCAVDLIYNLSREYKFDGGQEFIYGNTPLRDTLYRNVFLLLMLMTEQVNLFLTEEKQEITSLETRDALEKILTDPRYNKQFNQILNDSEPYDGVSGWRNTSWFGSFLHDENKYYPWIFHSRLGWLYFQQATTNNGFWLYSPKLGWFWSNKSSFSNNMIYLAAENGWSYLYSSDQTTMFERYYSYTKNSWILF